MIAVIAAPLTSAAWILTVFSEPVVSSGPPSGVEKILLQIFVWFGGMVLSVAIITTMLGMIASMRGSGAARRLGGKVNRMQSSATMQTEIRQHQGSISGGSPGGIMQTVQTGGGVGQNTGEGGMPMNSGPAVSVADDGTMFVDPANSDEKVGLDSEDASVFSFEPDNPDPGEVPLSEKVGYLDEKYNSGRVTDAAKTVSETAEKIKDASPGWAKKIGSMAKRGGSAYKKVFMQPDVASSIGETLRIARESPIGRPPQPQHTEDDPVDPVDPIDRWDVDADPDVQPLTPEEHEKFTEGSMAEFDRTSRADFVAGEEDLSTFEQLPEAEKRELMMKQFTQLDGFDDFTDYEQAQLLGNMREFYGRAADPEMVHDAFTGMGVESVDDRASMSKSGLYEINEVESMEEFAHEMGHRVAFQNKFNYKRDYQFGEDYDGFTPRDLSRDFSDISDENGNIDFDFSEDSDFADPTDHMLHDESAAYRPSVDDKPVGVGEWGEETIEELEDRYGVEVDDDVLSSLDSEMPEATAEREASDLASAANKALFKQQMVAEKAMSEAGTFADEELMEELQIGGNAYSTTDAQETISKTGDVLHTSDEEFAREHVTQLQEHHPELVEAYTEKLGASETAKKFLD